LFSIAIVLEKFDVVKMCSKDVHFIPPMYFKQSQQ